MSYQISEQDEKRAVRAAKKSNQRKCKMSAIILCKSTDGKAYQILDAFNYNINEKAARRLSIHAEQHLAAKAAKKGLSLKDKTVLVYRLKAKGPGTSKPCSMCKSILEKAGVKYVIYHDGNIWIRERI